jgi:inward rectifier potassium channel
MADSQIRSDLNATPSPAAPSEAPPAKEAPHRRVRERKLTVGSRQIITQGLEPNLWKDFYHNAMTVTWPAFLGVLTAAFLVLNAVFAALYWLGDAPVANAKNGDIVDLFFFSVETTTTVGYGDMHPQTVYGHLVATVEGFISVVLLAAMTGLVFARFSRPQARLLFSRNPVIATHNGVPALMFRIANERNNFISDARIKLWVLRPTVTPEGRTITRFFRMPLERDENPAFALSWTLYHLIDAESPLFGITEEQLAESVMNFIVSVNGLDETSAQTVHGRHSYAAQDVIVGHEYVDILGVREDGLRRIDYSKFHDTRPADPRPLDVFTQAPIRSEASAS